MSIITALIARNDIFFFYALNRKIRCTLLNYLMNAVTQLGSLAFAIISSLFFLLYDDLPGITLAKNLIVSQIFIHVLKRIINRPRPYKTFDWAIALKPPKCKYSLPSGHSSSALSIALVISDFYPGLKLMLISIAFIVGISRIYLGFHYPTDVSVGFLISYSVFKGLEYII